MQAGVYRIESNVNEKHTFWWLKFLHIVFVTAHNLFHVANWVQAAASMWSPIIIPVSPSIKMNQNLLVFLINCQNMVHTL